MQAMPIKLYERASLKPTVPPLQQSNHHIERAQYNFQEVKHGKYGRNMKTATGKRTYFTKNNSTSKTQQRRHRIEFIYNKMYKQRIRKYTKLMHSFIQIILSERNRAPFLMKLDRRIIIRLH
mmetsp:Transcript_9316/g.14017  ORF Transcript_9316/g.14017 Transcript_9316/m.14017 type:complete len:122 (-) Transcript_9316:27-392(-)